jgi:hypothetical protein
LSTSDSRTGKTTANRTSYIPLSSFILLDHACQLVAEVFDEYPYHVGSSTQRSDWRDVDVRLVLDADQYDRWFSNREFWSLFCLAMSEYLSRVTGLPVDFQVQTIQHANELYGDQFRNPLGTGRLYAGGPRG